MGIKFDETTAAGPTSRINPADFLAALERAGYRVSVESPFGEPSGAIGTAVCAVTLCGLAEALAVPASLRRFYDGAVKSVAAEEAGHGG